MFSIVLAQNCPKEMICSVARQGNTGTETFSFAMLPLRTRQIGIVDSVNKRLLRYGEGEA